MTRAAYSVVPCNEDAVTDLALLNLAGAAMRREEGAMEALSAVVDATRAERRSTILTELVRRAFPRLSPNSRRQIVAAIVATYEPVPVAGIEQLGPATFRDLLSRLEAEKGSNT